jgi:hypothetical protein
VKHPSRQLGMQLGVATTTGVVGHAASTGGSIVVLSAMQWGCGGHDRPGQIGAAGIEVYV